MVPCYHVTALQACWSPISSTDGVFSFVFSTETVVKACTVKQRNGETSLSVVRLLLDLLLIITNNISSLPSSFADKSLNSGPCLLTPWLLQVYEMKCGKPQSLFFVCDGLVLACVLSNTLVLYR